MRKTPILQTIFEKLGGCAVLGEPVASQADWARVVTARIPLSALAHAKANGFTERELDAFVIPARTRRHRDKKHEPLSIEESDRLVRLTRIQSLAEDVFADAEKASHWLRQPLGILDHKPPLEVAQTEAGARLIEELLAKIDWGAAA